MTAGPWRRRAPGMYDRGAWSIRREPDSHYPDRPWVLYRALVGGRKQYGRFHTLTIAKAAAR